MVCVMSYEEGVLRRRIPVCERAKPRKIVIGHGAHTPEAVSA